MCSDSARTNDKKCRTTRSSFWVFEQLLLITSPLQILENTTVAKIMPSLHHVCAAAEFHLESYWALRITGGGDYVAGKKISENRKAGWTNFPSKYPSQKLPILRELRGPYTPGVVSNPCCTAHTSRLDCFYWIGSTSSKLNMPCEK